MLPLSEMNQEQLAIYEKGKTDGLIEAAEFIEEGVKKTALIADLFDKTNQPETASVLVRVKELLEGIAGKIRERA